MWNDVETLTDEECRVIMESAPESIKEMWQQAVAAVDAEDARRKKKQLSDKKAEHLNE